MKVFPVTSSGGQCDDGGDYGEDGGDDSMYVLIHSFSQSHSVIIIGKMK